LWFEHDNVLVVADLHLEKGSAFAQRGQMLPPYDTADTLGRLSVEVEALAPRTVVFLGDGLHDRRAGLRIAVADIGRLAELARGRALLWVRGNHDPDGPGRLPGDGVVEVTVAGLALRHEPSPGPGHAEAAGHLHPCARVTARGRAVRRRCFVTDGDRLILPAFGAYAGGLNVRDKAFSGLFSQAPLAVALGARKAHAVAWAMLSPD
jgi:DNA ligase-associated metallophosphoesterase